MFSIIRHSKSRSVQKQRAAETRIEIAAATDTKQLDLDVDQSATANEPESPILSQMPSSHDIHIQIVDAIRRNQLLVDDQIRESQNQLSQNNSTSQSQSSTTINIASETESTKSPCPSQSTEKPHECDVCGRSFQKAAGLGMHKKMHFTERLARPFACSICQKTFLTVAFLERHKRTHQGQGKGKLMLGGLTCLQCNKLFSSQRTLRKHRLLHLAKSDRPFACEQCDQRFVEKYRLKLHKQCKHGLLPPNTIMTNGKSSTSPLSDDQPVPPTERSMKQVPPRMRHACSKCEKSFDRPGRLLVHERSHANRQRDLERPMPGRTSAVFTSKLTKHRASQPSGKLFDCRLCGALYNRQSALTRHLKNHDDKLTHQRDLCGYATHRSDSLNTHPHWKRQGLDQEQFKMLKALLDEGNVAATSSSKFVPASPCQSTMASRRMDATVNAVIQANMRQCSHIKGRGRRATTNRHCNHDGAIQKYAFASRSHHAHDGPDNTNTQTVELLSPNTE